ncbi:MAG: leucine-rich repeat domain-containing protein [Polyangia bacterium]
MRNVAISVGVLALVLVIWVATRKPVSLDDELATLPPEERQALTALVSAAGLSPAQLRAVAPGVLTYNPKAVAIQSGHVVELRLADTPLTKADDVAKLPALRTLWLDGAKLETLRPLSGLKSLKTLNLSRCQLRSVTDLVDLPALTSLDLSGNQIEDVSALVGLPALEQLTLSGNPIQRLPSSAPSRWKVKSDMTDAAAAQKSEPALEKPDNWIEKDKAPKTSGTAKPGRVTGVVTNAEWSVKGDISVLQGTVVIDGIPGDSNINGTDAALEVEVESGQVRGYIEKALRIPGSTFKRRHGYAFCDASPGKPGRVSGSLTSGGPGNYGVSQSYHVIFESIGGEAKGIKFRLMPPSR